MALQLPGVRRRRSWCLFTFCACDGVSPPWLWDPSCHMSWVGWTCWGCTRAEALSSRVVPLEVSERV